LRFLSCGIGDDDAADSLFLLLNVDFYNGPAFNNPRAAAARFNFNLTQRDQLVDFMRGVNTLQNIDVARRELKEILANNGDPQAEQATRL